MAATTIHEERAVYRVGGIPKYQVRVTCTAAGDLPDVGLFVYQIVDSRNPLQDVFVRIAEVADFSTSVGYLSDRFAATVAGAEYWRSNILVKEYDDIEVASSATSAIFDRVNALTNDYKTYIDSFVTSGESIDFPTADPSVVEGYKTAYTTAYTAYTTAQAAQATAKNALAAAEAALSEAQTELQYWVDLRTKFEQETDNDKQTINDAYTNFNNFVSDGVGNAKQTIGAIDAFLFSYQGKFGSGTRKVSMASAGYVNCVSSDVGKPVQQTNTGHSGELTTFNNSAREWWIIPDGPDDTFISSDLVTVSGGTGEGNPSSSILVGTGPMDAEIAALQAARNSFDSARQQAINDVASAKRGVDHHDLTSSYIGDQVTQHSSNVTQQQNSVASAQAEYNKAQGDVQTAYTALRQAYNNVKAVCPNWSPTPPFPPVP